MKRAKNRQRRVWCRCGYSWVTILHPSWSQDLQNMTTNSDVMSGYVWGKDPDTKVWHCLYKHIGIPNDAQWRRMVHEPADCLRVEPLPTSPGTVVCAECKTFYARVLMEWELNH